MPTTKKPKVVKKTTKRSTVKNTGKGLGNMKETMKRKQEKQEAYYALSPAQRKKIDKEAKQRREKQRKEEERKKQEKLKSVFTAIKMTNAVKSLKPATIVKKFLEATDLKDTPVGTPIYTVANIGSQIGFGVQQPLYMLKPVYTSPLSIAKSNPNPMMSRSPLLMSKYR